MLKVDNYSAKGTKLTTQVSLPIEWEAKENPSLIAQAIRVYTDRAHIGLASTQTRAEVKRTTKKLYSQKGTGGARHGSRKAPIFVGGGVAFGPRPVKRELELPLSMRRKALAVGMTQLVKAKKVIAAEMNFKKTNEVKTFIDKVLGKEVKAIFIINGKNAEMTKYVRNIKNVKVTVFPNINVFSLFFGGNVVFDNSIFEKAKKEIKK